MKLYFLYIRIEPECIKASLVKCTSKTKIKTFAYFLKQDKFCPKLKYSIYPTGSKPH